MPWASIVPAEAAHVTPDDPCATVAANETVSPVPIAVACGVTLTLTAGVGVGADVGADPELQPEDARLVMRITQKQKL